MLPHRLKEETPLRATGAAFRVRGAILIRGPSDGQVARDDWRFGFQVPGEPDIRWRQAEQIDRVGNGLIERKE